VTTTAEAGASVEAPPPPPGDNAIATRGLTKRFSSGQLAVADLDLTVPRGAIFGFLGPNGSGKTTTIRMLLGLVSPTAGSHELLGVPMPEGWATALPKVGSLIEGPAFHPHLSGEANLRRCDAADRTADPRTSRRRIGAALERVGLGAAAGKRYKAYSLGMKQRLGIAAALLRPRELLILDEPTNGLDPQGTREVRTLIRDIAAEGTTVFVSSHLLAEIEQVCTDVAVMRAGRLAAQSSLEELRAEADVRIRVETPDTGRAGGVLKELGLADVRMSGTEVSAELGELQPERVCAEMVGGGVAVRGLAVVRPSLEDVFVQLTGEGFDVNG
jgi:ABC-2 type transport system ATP-binding protein